LESLNICGDEAEQPVPFVFSLPIVLALLSDRNNYRLQQHFFSSSLLIAKDERLMT